MSLGIEISGHVEEHIARLCGVLNSPQGPHLNQTARLAQHLFRLPVAMIGFLNESSECPEVFGVGGLDPRQFAELVGARDGPLQRMVVTDTRRGMPPGAGAGLFDQTGIRAFATQPLSSADGIDLGVFLIADRVPRPDLCGATVDLLADLAAIIMTHIEFRITAAQVLAADADWRVRDASLRSAADTAPVLLWVAAADGFYTYFNKTWERRTGISVKQLLSTQLEGLLQPDDEPRYLDAFWGAITRREPLATEVRLKLSDGEYGRFLVHAAPRLLDDATFAGLAGSYTDAAPREAA